MNCFAEFIHSFNSFYFPKPHNFWISFLHHFATFQANICKTQLVDFSQSAINLSFCQTDNTLYSIFVIDVIVINCIGCNIINLVMFFNGCSNIRNVFTSLTYIQVNWCAPGSITSISRCIFKKFIN